MVTHSHGLSPSQLEIQQGADYVSAAGPMVQAAVDDVPQNFIAGKVGPLSMTSEGRLRVSMLPARMGTEFVDAAAQRMWSDGMVGSYSGSAWN